MSVLLTERDDRGVVTLTIDRPEVRNAMSPELMTALTDTLADLADDPDVRVVVLTGSGEVFSAGGDLEWMREGVDKDRAEHEADSARLADVFRAVDEFPAPVVGRMNGHAIAGGTGLMCACDVVVAVRGAKMGFTEVRLGIAPATISRIVLPKIGPSAARRWFLTGELFDTEVARDMGLVHEVVAPDELDDRVEEVVSALLLGAPEAQRRTKTLVRDVLADPVDADRHTIPVIADLRVSAEGQEGMAAFFERRPAAWVPTDGASS
ncbi:enoyl-CoA hydratase-related protein [Salsipaludibacter albus]|uniref:enoyl-CoA hydratase-related protein n=1 Tax=Salsipaludibacter albus TaxID=2849650 RepID=UPI001EE441A0